MIRQTFYIVGGIVFLVSAVAYFYVRIRLQPRDDPDLDDLCYEFEEQHPAYARYLKWSRITLAGVVVALLLLFIAAVL